MSLFAQVLRLSRLGILETTHLDIAFRQNARGTCVFRRMYPPRLYKKGRIPPALKTRESVYILEENTNYTRPNGKIKIILTNDVEGLGFAGEELAVSKTEARDILFPADLAIYATPENFKKTEHLRQLHLGKPRQSIWAQKTIRALRNMNLPIPMNPKVTWKLNKTHVRVAFRNVGVVLAEDSILLPTESISEPQDVEIKVIVNKSESVPVKAIVYHFYTDLRDTPSSGLPDLPPVWQESANLSLEDIAVEYARKIGPAPPPIQ